MVDDSEDCIQQVSCLFLPRGLNCQYKSQIAFAKVSEKVSCRVISIVFLNIHEFVDQAEDLVKGNFVSACIINDVFVIRKMHAAGVREDK